MNDADELTKLGGKQIQAKALRELLKKAAISSSKQVVDSLLKYPLVGLVLTLEEDDDLSEMGADFQWYSISESEEESFEFYPGIDARAHGFIAIGSCLEGSGDPYFINMESGELVRIPHDASAGETFDLSSVEVVATSIGALLKVACVERRK